MYLQEKLWKGLTMIIDCISDLHGFYPKLEGGDLLIVAGDLTANNTVPAWKIFFNWLESQTYRKKLYIAGNHDNFLAQSIPTSESIEMGLIPTHNAEYLCDSGTEFENLKIWGSPWTKTFEGINPNCTAFTFDTEKQLDEKWNLIPNDIDILVTHSPPFGIFDVVTAPIAKSVGSCTLREQVMRRIKPKLHLFGHIHESGGRILDAGMTKFVNASHVNEHQPMNKPVRIVL